MKRREFIIKTLAAGTSIYLTPIFGDILGHKTLPFAHSLTNNDLKLYPARYWLTDSNGNSSCTLCPNGCHTEGNYGICRSRIKKNGKFYTEAYSQIAAIHDDPIEKAPLYHFFPGSRTVCLAAAGCNARCKYCQNWQLSQESPSNIKNDEISPDEVVQLTIDRGYDTLGFSYTEPMTYLEYVIDTCIAARSRNLHTYVASAAYVNRTPFRDLAEVCDAYVLALKGFDDDFYEDVVGLRLNRVLDILVYAKELGCHLELVNLIVPTYNDDMTTIGSMASWIGSNLGEDVPLHFLRFYPKFKLSNLPPTPISTMETARKTSMEKGLKYVYLGNAPGHEGNSTYCPSCGNVVIGRIGYRVTRNMLTDGKCNSCGASIPGYLDKITLDDFEKRTKSKKNKKHKK